MTNDDPNTPRWRPTQFASTSARLQEAQRALAASQADLTRALAERDEARAELAEVQRERDTLLLANKLTGTARIHIERERDLARAELASARQELDALRLQLAAALDDRDFTERLAADAIVAIVQETT